MTSRQAKKVLRNVMGLPPRCRIYCNFETLRRACRVSNRNWCRAQRCNRTGAGCRGYRWGRWDPKLPIDEKECPF